MTELDVYRRFNLPLLYWERIGDDPKRWKGPAEKGWNDPTRVYDLSRFDPAVHNLGTFTGRAIAPGQYLLDVDFDKLNAFFAKTFFSGPLNAHFVCGRPGKPLSHAFYTTSEVFSQVEYRALTDDKPYLELRGTCGQTMLAPSLYMLPDVHVQLVTSSAIDHVAFCTVRDAALDYSLAMLTTDTFPGGCHHDHRLALAGFLLKRQFDEDRVTKLLQAICTYQVQCQVPDMGEYDVDDARDVVESTAARLKARERVKGGSVLRKMHADFVTRLQSWLPRVDGTVTVDDFHAYMPSHSYLFIPSRELWPATSVNARIAPIATGMNDKGDEVTIPANLWLDRNRSVEQMTWAPGMPMLIADRLVSDGGWIERPGLSCFNLYRPPTIAYGDATKADPWLRHVHNVYPEDADHLVRWLAHRVQCPHEKINHAVVLGGAPGIGKDTILEPVKSAIGPWNFAEIAPSHLLGRFNSFVKSVILRISEGRDLGEMNRFAFYEHIKTYAAAPPDVLRVDEKNIREHSVFNVCGIVITTNHQSDGIYLPADDRRHYVMWSTRKQEDFLELDKDYWRRLYAWYDAGGRNHVAAYLSRYDLSNFDPKAPPPKTPAFWAIVDANRSTEDAELADVLEALSNPDAVTLQMLIEKCREPRPADEAPADEGVLAENLSLALWLEDRKNARQIPHRMKTAEYVPHRNAAAKDGLWKIAGRRQVVYVKETLSVPEREKATGRLK